MEEIDGDNRSTSSASSIANSSTPFLNKTYDLVDHPSTDSVVSWSENGDSFVVWNVPEFSSDLLPKYFKHNKFSSFVRQLNTYGFKKIDPERWEFANEGFLRGKKHLLKGISRRKAGYAQAHQVPQIQSTSVGSCVEVGRFGIDEEVESLKRDKNVLMQELVRLRQQQQGTDNQLHTVVQRVHLMEQHQHQMMSFLAKAMQRPGVLTQLVEEQNESNRRIFGVTKKRRLPKQDEENFVGNHGSLSPNRQIVMYQPLINEAAHAMLRKILNMNTSSRLEPTMKNANGFLIENVPSPSNTLSTGISSGKISEVTVSEVVQPSSQYCAESGFLNSHEDAALPNFNTMQGIVPKSSVKLPDVSFKGSTSEGMDLMSGFVQSEIPVPSDGFSSDIDIDALLDDVPKLPGINDIFWEQFLSASPFTEECDDNHSSALKVGPGKEHESQFGRGSGWDRTIHMNHLTEQMELLASGSNGK